MSGMSNARPQSTYCIVVNSRCLDFAPDLEDPARSCGRIVDGSCPHLPEYQDKMRKLADQHPNMVYCGDLFTENHIK